MKNLNYLPYLIIALLLIYLFILKNECSNLENEIIEISKEESIDTMAFAKIFDGSFGLTKIPLGTARKMVHKFTNDKPTFPRSTYFYGDNFDNLKDYISADSSKVKGIKIYFGSYYDDRDSAMVGEVYRYFEDVDLNGMNRDTFLKYYSNHVTAIMAFTDDKGEIINPDEMLLNLGGLCPPKCAPETYGKTEGIQLDPLYYEIK